MKPKFNFWGRNNGVGSENGDDDKFSQNYSMSIHEKAKKKRLWSKDSFGH